MPLTNNVHQEESLHSSDFNWLKAAQQGAYALATATMVSQEVDSQVLQAAAQLVEALGSTNETFAVNESGINVPITGPNPTYTADVQNLINNNGYTLAGAEAFMAANDPSVTPTITNDSVPLQGNYTINQLIGFQSTFAGQSGGNNAQEANTIGSAIGAAQAEESQNIQIAQQYVTAETNKATSTDPQAVSTATSELQTLYQGYSQWAQLSGSVLNG